MIDEIKGLDNWLTNTPEAWEREPNDCDACCATGRLCNRCELPPRNDIIDGKECKCLPDSGEDIRDFNFRFFRCSECEGDGQI